LTCLPFAAYWPDYIRLFEYPAGLAVKGMSVKERRSARRQAVTIKEVAELAGVSQMTVSRVLNKSDVVRENTRRKVEDAVKALNYRPNLLARGLAGGQAYFIGIIFNNPSNSYISEILVGALNQCRSMGHYLVLEDSRSLSGPISSDDVVDRVATAGLNGVLVIPPLSENRELLDGLKREGIPAVIIAPNQGLKDFPSVAIDDEAAARIMMQELFDQGHVDIAFIRGDEEQSAARRRYRGYLGALRDRGIPVREEWIAQGDFNYRSGMSAARHMLSANRRPSVIFACNDDMAAGAVAAIQAQGLKVPEDISVVGFDDSSIASAIWPSLTTIRQPISEMAANAVSLLATVLSGDLDPDASAMVTLDVDLVRRASLEPQLTTRGTRS
jgi:LacI family transcriptional regulator